MATKLNPRRRPATQADVDRARTTATAEAMKRAIELVLFVLIDKHDAPKADVRQLAAEINYAADSITKGYVSWSDVWRTLREEYDVEVEI